MCWFNSINSSFHIDSLITLLSKSQATTGSLEFFQDCTIQCKIHNHKGLSKHITPALLGLDLQLTLNLKKRLIWTSFSLENTRNRWLLTHQKQSLWKSFIAQHSLGTQLTRVVITLNNLHLELISTMV